MSNPPAFQLYAADFYMDTITWETDDIGVYFCLLMAEWVNGPLEDDTRKLAKIAKKTHQKFIKNWSKISQKFSKLDTGMLVNLRLEGEREKQRLYVEKQRVKGCLSADKRYNRGSTVVQPRHQPESNSSSSSSIKNICNNRFIIPTSGEISEYCLKRKNNIDPEIFIAHYTSNGWMVGKNKMKDWKAAIITWEKRNGGNNGNRSKNAGTGKSKAPGSAGRAESDDQPYPIDREY